MGLTCEFFDLNKSSKLSPSVIMGTPADIKLAELAVNPKFQIGNPASPDYGWTLAGAGGSIANGVLTILPGTIGSCLQTTPELEDEEDFVWTFDFLEVDEFQWPLYPLITTPGLYNFIDRIDFGPWVWGIEWDEPDPPGFVIRQMSVMRLYNWLFYGTNLGPTNFGRFDLVELPDRVKMITYGEPSTGTSNIVKIDTTPPGP